MTSFPLPLTSDPLDDPDHAALHQLEAVAINVLEDWVASVGVGDPLPQYQKESEKGQPNGYAGITAGGGINLSAAGSPGIELRSTDGGTPYFDFSNDAGADYDARLFLSSNTLLRVLFASADSDFSVYGTGNMGIHIRSSDGNQPHLDFSNAGTGSADARLVLTDDDTLAVQGAALNATAGFQIGGVALGATPGGELGGTWAAPTVDATHSGSAHHTRLHDHSNASDSTSLAPTLVTIAGGAAGTIPFSITGHASQTADLLVVETSGGTDLFSISASGLITAARSGSGTSTGIQQSRYVDGNDALGIINYARVSDGASGAQGAVALNDIIWQMRGYASDGSAFRESAYITMMAAATPADSSVPGKILLATTAAGTSQTPVTRLQVDALALTFSDALDIAFNTSTGTKIGTASTQKLGIWGATPIVRPSAYTQTYTTASKTSAAIGSVALTDSSGGTGNATVQAISAGYVQAEVANNFADLTGAYNALRTDVVNIKNVLTQVIDDLQAVGILA